MLCSVWVIVMDWREDQGEAGGEASPRARPPPCGHHLAEGDAREVVLPPGAALPVQAAA